MGNCARVRDGLWAAALVLRARDAILRPHFHRYADDVVALLTEQIAGNAGVHSTAHAKQHAFLVRIHRGEEFRSIADRVNERTGTLTNLLERIVNRHGWCAERVMPIRSSATTSTSPAPPAKQWRGSTHRFIS